MPINKVTITQPAAGSTLTIADGKTITCTQDTSLDEAVAMSSKMTLALGAANLKAFVNAAGTAAEWASGIKLGSFTRDMTAVGGAVAYTGVGFKPSAILFFGNIGGTYAQTIGIDNGTTKFCVYYSAADTTANTVSYSIAAYPSGAGQLGLISAIGADGFTITWTKDGSPTGTLQIFYIAFR